MIGPFIRKNAWLAVSWKDEMIDVAFYFYNYYHLYSTIHHFISLFHICMVKFLETIYKKFHYIFKAQIYCKYGGRSISKVKVRVKNFFLKNFILVYQYSFIRALHTLSTSDLIF